MLQMEILSNHNLMTFNRLNRINCNLINKKQSSTVYFGLIGIDPYLCLVVEIDPS